MNRTRLREINSRMAGLLLLTLLPFSAGQVATAADAQTETGVVVQGLQDWLDGTEDLEGSFLQALISGALGSGLEESGRLYVKRPGRMRWDYRDPDTKVAIVDGDRTWLYLQDEAQLILGRLGEEGALLPSLIAAERRLADEFDADLIATPEGGGDGAFWLRLRPRLAADSFESVVVTLRPPGFAIESAEVLDSAGNRMLYRFSEMRRNTGVPDDLFRFEPPAGTTILGSH
jgi:outer membrane lipoprotein carrier protein